MSQDLVVNNVTYKYPSAGEDPGWGESATGWAAAVTSVLNSLQGPGDLIETSFAVPSGSSSGNVSSLVFDGNVVRAAFIEYSVYRKSTANPSGKTQAGQIVLYYDTDASAGNKWNFSHRYQGNADITFDVDNNGQITYSSSDIGSTSYVGLMKFKASTLGVT